MQDDPNGGGWFDTIHPDDRQRTLASWSSALRTGRPFHDVHRARERSGRYERFLVDGVAIRDDEGRTVCWIGAKTALGDPEVDCVEPRRGHAVFAGSGRLDRSSDSSRHGLDQAPQRSALSAQPIYVGPKTNAGRRIDAPLLTADAAPRSPQSPEPNLAIGKNFLEAVSAAADAALIAAGSWPAVVEDVVDRSNGRAADGTGGTGEGCLAFAAAAALAPVCRSPDRFGRRGAADGLGAFGSKSSLDRTLDRPWPLKDGDGYGCIGIWCG